MTHPQPLVTCYNPRCQLLSSSVQLYPQQVQQPLPNACSHSKAPCLPLKGSSEGHSYPECWLEVRITLTLKSLQIIGLVS
jgi:hypothetical protein